MLASRVRAAAVLVAVTLLPAAAGASLVPATAAPDVAVAVFVAPTFTGTIGQPGHAGVYAWGAATAADGTILIGDYWNYDIKRYSTDGRLLQRISRKGTGPGQNMGPHGVAVSPVDGSIYVADMNAPWEIDVFDAAGAPVRTISTFVPGVTVPYPYVTRLAVGSTGLLYLVSSHNVPPTFSHRVVVLNPDGSYRSSFGTNGSEPGQLGLIRGIDLGPNDEVYLVDTSKGAVQVFSKEGAFLRSFGAGRFRGDIRGVRVDDARGWVYVVDAAGSQIEKFTLAGDWLAAFGSEGTGPGQFRDGGRELALDAAGNLHAPDFGNYRVNVYTSSGAFLRSYPSPVPVPRPDGFNQAQGVAVRPDGRSVYTADTYSHRVQRFAPGGNLISTWGFRGSTDPLAMNYPRGVTVDPLTGDVLLLNSREGNIKRYSATGTFRSEFGSWGADPGQFNLARGIWTDGRRIYVADSNNRRVQVLSMSGAPLLSMPCGGRPTGTGPQLLGGCTGVVADEAGTIYAAAVSEHKIYVWSPTGTLLRTVGTQGSGPGQLRAPYGVALHEGLLYVTESSNHRVSVFSPAGDYLGRFGSRGGGSGQFVSPRALSFDASGRLYVMDSQNERIVTFAVR